MTTRRGLRSGAVCAAAVLLLAGCGSSAASAPDTVAKLGAVPIPTAPSAAPPPQADEGHPQLLAMGAPVYVTLPGARGVIVATGPYFAAPPLPTSAPAAQDNPVVGTFTLHLTAWSGSFRVALGDLNSRDEQGRTVALTAVGPDSVQVSPAAPAKLVLRAQYHSGSAQLTLRHDGKVLAVWDFSVELD
ncbi:MAG TPA: hypothetical protein VHU88_17795 [Sporichthyaceae bacterium]|nr:hypothetical protein [Sporichthyaceae bacterium]